MSLAFTGRRTALSTFFLAAAATVFSVAPVTASAAWTTTRTAAALLEGATRIGSLDAAQPMRVTVALNLRDAAALDTYNRRIGTPGDALFGQALSSREFMDRHAPTQAQAQAVADYLAASGLRNVEIAGNRLLVSAEGRAVDVRRAFNTDLASFLFEGRTVFANTRAAQVPQSLAGSVMAVLGLQNALQLQPMVAQPDATVTKGHNPLDFPTAYHVGSVGAPTATTVGIITAGDMSGTLTDLATYVSENTLAPPITTVVNVGPVGTDTSGTIEWDLDSQSILGMSGGQIGGIVFYAGTSLLLTDITAAMNQAVTENTVRAINVSLGTCEKNYQSSNELSADESIFAQAISQGQTFFVSSGDAGAKQGCNSRNGLFKQVSYPASSGRVVAVGGTTLSTDSVGGAYVGEKAWSKSGGGKSVITSRPAFQPSSVGTMRGIPDISFSGDPNSGATIVYNGSHSQVGGTSLSSPLAAAVWARLQTAHGNGLGFAAPIIYHTYNASHTGFHDVTTGNNGILGTGYTAGPGYDFVTGLGSLDVEKFNASLVP